MIHLLDLRTALYLDASIVCETQAEPVRVCVDCGADSTLLDHSDRCPACAESDDCDAEPLDTYNDLAELDDQRGGWVVKKALTPCEALRRAAHALHCEYMRAASKANTMLGLPNEIAEERGRATGLQEAHDLIVSLAEQASQ